MPAVQVPSEVEVKCQELPQEVTLTLWTSLEEQLQMVVPLSEAISSEESQHLASGYHRET